MNIQDYLEYIKNKLKEVLLSVDFRNDRETELKDILFNFSNKEEAKILQEVIEFLKTPQEKEQEKANAEKALKAIQEIKEALSSTATSTHKAKSVESSETQQNTECKDCGCY